MKFHPCLRSSWHWMAAGDGELALFRKAAWVQQMVRHPCTLRQHQKDSVGFREKKIT